MNAATMPRAIEAEQAVLGGLLVSGDAFAKVSDLLTEGDFFRHDHRLIYRAVSDLHASATDVAAVDWVTVESWFSANGELDAVGNGGYLVELASGTASAANVRAYAEVVRNAALLRKMIEFGEQVVKAGLEPGGKGPHELLAEASQKLAQLSGGAKVGGAKTMRELGMDWMHALVQRAEAPDRHMGLLTPWGDFNRLTCGLKPGDLMVLAGRPSMGKSAVAINLAVAASLAGKRGLYFSLEMTGESIFNRAVAALANVPLAWLRKPDDSDDAETYWPRIESAVSQLRAAPLLTDESASLTQEQIVARVMREHQRAPLDFIAVDHIHLMQLPGKTKEATEMGDITRSLKAVAKRCGVPVIALAQLNRSLEARPDKRPKMADLRESGAIEQDADLIVFVYRDDYYAQQEGRESRAPGIVELIVAKQREGETGTVYLRNQLGFGRVDELKEPWVPEQAAQHFKTSSWGRKKTA